MSKPNLREIRSWSNDPLGMTLRLTPILAGAAAPVVWLYFGVAAWLLMIGGFLVGFMYGVDRGMEAAP